MPFNRFARILQESPQTGELQPNVFLRWPLLKAYLDYLKVTCSRFLHARALPTIFERPCCIFFLGLPIHLPTFQIHLYTWGLFKEANSLQKHRIFWMETTIILSGVCSVIIYCNLFWNRSKTGSAWNLHVRCSCLSGNIKLCYVRVHLLDCRIYFPYFSFSYTTKVL